MRIHHLRLDTKHGGLQPVLSNAPYTKSERDGSTRLYAVATLKTGL